jgi:hypothetical protein
MIDSRVYLALPFARAFPSSRAFQMFLRSIRRCALLPLVWAVGCSKSSSDSAPTAPTPALSGSLQLGDQVQLNVNGRDACTNATMHSVRLVAVGTKAMVFEDTQNPAGGFTADDYARFAARFDTLVYPLDVGAFGAPTDIDNNGHIGIVFTRAVNELTPAHSSTYTLGFTFSRDLFPYADNGRASACATSNQGEMFYVLAPDPNGTINGNVRTKGLIDSASTSVLAHEFQHLINASRKLYVNTAASGFEEKWLDEGLAHTAEELLFFHQAGLTPRNNLSSTDVRANATTLSAFNVTIVQGGNLGRYQSYLQKPSQSSPYAANDSLSTRGAAQTFLRYLADETMAGVTRSPTGSVVVTGPGSANLPGGTAGAEYSAVVVNTSTSPTVSATYTLTGSNVIPPSPTVIPLAGPLMASVVPLGHTIAGGTMSTDEAFESRLRQTERDVLSPRIEAARAWYRQRTPSRQLVVSTQPAFDVTPFTPPDGDIWFRLVNNTVTGVANVQQVFGIDVGSSVRDWSATHAVDDAASVPVAPEFQQLSWNWHSIFTSTNGSYPLTVQALVNGVGASGTVVAGGAAFFKLAVPANGTATISLASQASAASSLQLLLVKTK